MGLLAAPFILAARGGLALANVAYRGLWLNRTPFARAFTLVAGMTVAGVAVDLNKDDDVPETTPATQLDPYYKGTEIRTPDQARPDEARSPTMPLPPGAVMPRAQPEIIADTYLERLYDPKTRAWLNRLPEAERAERTAEITENRALLRDAIIKYESINVTPEMIADYQRDIVQKLQEQYPDKDENYFYTRIPSPEIVELRLRGKLLTELHPELRVNEEQGAALDRRLREPEGTHFERQVSIIAYYTDSPEARARGLRSYNIDREQVIEKANENIIIEVPQRQGALPGHNGPHFG